MTESIRMTIHKMFRLCLSLFGKFRANLAEFGDPEERAADV